MVCIHPCFWTSMDEIKNVEQMRMIYTRARNKHEIEVQAQKVPTSVTQNWMSQLPPNSFLADVLNYKPDESKENGVLYYKQVKAAALGMLLFMRNVYNHANTKNLGRGVQLNLNELQETLYCIYPEFMSNFVEQIFDITEMREALKASTTDE
ncbi:uncharacterized protein LOC130015170 [Mercurialis annua]|uniref:uncharacterized protein LOC130015170 n=1 Tax=Mercurialis annua TaxID=3986 RepID=UPI0024ACF23F|nr:uncharacterized protein LOC130015170 [Mercurialis annua]